MIKLRAFLIVLPAALALFTPAGAQGGASPCPMQVCSYLPLVGNPSPAIVDQFDTHPNKFGLLQIEGEVLAVKEKPVYDVLVEIRIYDAQGVLIDVQSGFPAFEATLPGQQNPFAVWTNTSLNDVQSGWKSDAIVTSWSLETDQDDRPLTVVAVQMDPYGQNGTSVTAEVRNDQPGRLEEVIVAIWSIRSVASLSTNPIPGGLDPGETVTVTSVLFFEGYPPYINVAGQGVLQP